MTDERTLTSPIAVRWCTRRLAATPPSRATLLGRARHRAATCAPDVESLCDEFERGAGAIILTEEVLPIAGPATNWPRSLEAQPAWSDVLGAALRRRRSQSRASLRTLQTLELLRNVTLLDRPMRLTALVSTLRAALRGARSASTSCATC